MLTKIQIQDIANQRTLISNLIDADLLEFCKIQAVQNQKDHQSIVFD